MFGGGGLPLLFFAMFWCQRVEDPWKNMSHVSRIALRYDAREQTETRMHSTRFDGEGWSSGTKLLIIDDRRGTWPV